jgi:acyl-CoA reductase-like NAD-dependent aldehyde dehydrogenase
VKLANDCPFGLGSNVFSTDIRRANEIARNLRAGMTSINDFATTYMCQVCRLPPACPSLCGPFPVVTVKTNRS